jgi:uncharacterized protein (UPF0147 family)
MASRGKQVAKALPFRAADLAAVTKATPYIRRLMQDSELQNNIRTAYDSSRSAYERLQRAKNLQKAVVEDKRLQKEVRKAAEALRDVSTALAEPPKKKRGWGRMVLLAVIGAGVALAASEKLRSKVLDTLFGAEEEFQYTPPTASPTTPPASPVTAA